MGYRLYFADYAYICTKIFIGYAMNDYRKVRFDMTPCSEDATDLLAAFLADEGYESFVPDEEGLTAYVPASAWSKDAVNNVIRDFPMNTTIQVKDVLVKGRDWNAEWEKNYFQPIVVGDKCVIHSTFHHDIPKVKYDIVIDPKMAFGTGHHATTAQVIESILAIDLRGRTVIDMGTGTAILSILTAMLGAKLMTAIEIDGFAYANAIENVEINGVCDVVRLINGDASALVGVEPADIFLANINRNVILRDIETYSSHLRNGGVMILSGFYEDDVSMIEAAARPLGLVTEAMRSRNKWTALTLRKHS